MSGSNTQPLRPSCHHCGHVAQDGEGIPITNLSNSIEWKCPECGWISSGNLTIEDGDIRIDWTGARQEQPVDAIRRKASDLRDRTRRRIRWMIREHWP